MVFGLVVSLLLFISLRDWEFKYIRSVIKIKFLLGFFEKRRLIIDVNSIMGYF